MLVWGDVGGAQEQGCHRQTSEVASQPCHVLLPRASTARAAGLLLEGDESQKGGTRAILAPHANGVGATHLNASSILYQKIRNLPPAISTTTHYYTLIYLIYLYIDIK